MAHDVDKVMSFYRPDATFTAPGVSLKGSQIRDFYVKSFKAFPKLEHTVKRVMGDAKLACLEWSATLTDHDGRHLSFTGSISPRWTASNSSPCAPISTARNSISPRRRTSEFFPFKTSEPRSHDDLANPADH